MAFSGVAAVSMSVSPFVTDEVATDMFITSAPSLLPASSKEDCVRVEGSKKRIDQRAPAQDGSLLLDLPRNLDRFIGQIEQCLNVRPRQTFDAEQVPMGKDGFGARTLISRVYRPGRPLARKGSRPTCTPDSGETCDRNRRNGQEVVVPAAGRPS